MSTNHRRERALALKGHVTRVTVQCDRCSLVLHATPPATLPKFWEQNLLGEILCERCVARDAEAAGLRLVVTCIHCGAHAPSDVHDPRTSWIAIGDVGFVCSERCHALALGRPAPRSAGASS